jgi:hypothetical protein
MPFERERTPVAEMLSRFNLSDDGCLKDIKMIRTWIYYIGETKDLICYS